MCAKNIEILIEILLENSCKCFVNSIAKFMAKVQFSRFEGWSCSFISPQETFQKNCRVEKTGTSAYCLLVNLDMFLILLFPFDPVSKRQTEATEF